MNPAAQAVGSILRFDKKVNSYKLALIRALNDVVLSYPDLSGTGLDVCVPLRKLAEYWLAYYWPFVDPQDPVMQGPQAMRGGVLGNDMSFRPALTSLRSAWMEHFGTAHPSDGFLLVAELRVPRIAAGYPPQLQRAYRVALTAVTKALAQPIRYAGPGGETHGVFPPPRSASDWPRAIPVPGTSPDEPSVLVSSRPVVGVPRTVAVDRGPVRPRVEPLHRGPRFLRRRQEQSLLPAYEPSGQPQTTQLGTQPGRAPHARREDVRVSLDGKEPRAYATTPSITSSPSRSTRRTSCGTWCPLTSTSTLT